MMARKSKRNSTYLIRKAKKPQRLSKREVKREVKIKTNDF
jgi:hypothetical protein